jgi:hypothetical protein
MNPYQIGDAEASLLENHSSSVRLQTCFSLVSQACARIVRYKLTESLRCPLQVLLPCCLSLLPCANCLGYANSTMEFERIAIQEREELKRERETRLTLTGGVLTLLRCRCSAAKMHVLVVEVANDML